MPFDPMKSALLVVDVQKAFADPVWGARNEPACERNIERLVAAYRERGLPVVLVFHDSTEPGSTLRPGAPGNAPRPFLPATAELTVRKTVNSAFYGTPDLNAWLRDQRIGSVAICGITTNHCCETTARMAGNLGYEVQFVLDATHTFDRTGPDGRVLSADALSQATATNLHGEFATVTSTEAFVSAFFPARAAR